MEKRKREPFIATPVQVYQIDNLNLCDKAIFSLILSYSDQGKDFYVSVDRIADFFCISVSSVKRSIKKLISGKYIEECSKGKYKCKAYRPTKEYINVSYVKMNSQSVKMNPQEYQNDTEKGVKMNPNKNTYKNYIQEKENKEKNSDEPNVVEIGREEFEMIFGEMEDNDIVKKFYSDGSRNFSDW